MTTFEHGQAGALDGALADLLDLGLLAKQAQWNVVGTRFRAIQELLDEVADLAHSAAHRVAQRAVTLGHSPDGRAVTITMLSSLPTIEAGLRSDVDVLTALTSILDALTTRIHAALEAFDKDLVTVDLFTGVLADIERYAWMLRAQWDQ